VSLSACCNNSTFRNFQFRASLFPSKNPALYSKLYECVLSVSLYKAARRGGGELLARERNEKDERKKVVTTRVRADPSFLVSRR